MDSSDDDSDEFQSADEFDDDSCVESKRLLSNHSKPKSSILNDTLNSEKSTEDTIILSKVICDKNDESKVVDFPKSLSISPVLSNQSKLIASDVQATEDETVHREGISKTSQINDTGIPVKTRSYKKKSERIKSNISSLPTPQKKSDIQPTINIVKAARPDVLIKDITSHFKSSLTSSVNKGLSTFQEKSSSLRGFVLGTSDEREGERFVYDEDRRRESLTVDDKAPTLLTDEILKLSNAFARLNADNSERVLSSNSAVSLSQFTDLGIDKIDDNNKADFERNEILSGGQNCDKVKSGENAACVESDCFVASQKLEAEKDNILENMKAEVTSGGTVSANDSVQDKGLDEGSVVYNETSEFVSTSLTLQEPIVKKAGKEADGWDDLDDTIDDSYLISEEEQNDSVTNIFQQAEGNSVHDMSQETGEVKDGWGDWSDNDDGTDEQIKEIPMPCNRSANLCDVSKDQVCESLKPVCKTQVDDAILSDKVPSVDGWENWESDEDCQLETENIENVVKERGDVIKKEIGIIEDHGNDDGWSDLKDEGVEYKSNHVQKTIECTNEEGWGDFEEFPEESKISQGDDDGWGDWGDDLNAETCFVGSVNKTPVMSNSTKVPSIGLGEGKLTSNESAGQSLETTEWKGWDNFGAKKDDMGMGGWGFGSLLNKATVVSSNLSVITKGISSVIESGLGVPDPETMARIHKLEEEKCKKGPELGSTDLQTESSLQFPYSNIAKIVEVAKVQELGSRVLSGGLGTLETIGKKTMEVLQEGDPGLRKKRALLVAKGQTLSNVLKEARDQSAAEDRRGGELAASRRCNFETLFDDYQGLVHLDALEMLSQQCQLRIEQLVQSMPSGKTQELQDTMEDIKELCGFDESDSDEETHSDSEEEMDAEEDKFEEFLNLALEQLQNEFSVKKIIEVHYKMIEWSKGEETRTSSSGQLYDKAISAIAELTALATQQFHKGGELLLLKERRKTAAESDGLSELTRLLCTEITAISKQVAVLLQAKEENSETLINNLHVEERNAISYIKQAWKLMLPVIQLGAL